MSAIDVAALLEPISDENPCGEDLEYDPIFLEMDLAAVGKEEQEVGDSVIEAEEPDWADLREKSLEVLKRSKDLRAALHLALASLKIDGFAGFAPALELIAGYLDRHWEGVHPRLDPDDDNDPTTRVNIITALADQATMLHNIRRTALTNSKALGRISLRGIALARGEISLSDEDGEGAPDLATVQGAFQDSEGEWLEETAEAIKLAASMAETIESTLSDWVGAANSADLSNLQKALSEAGGALASYTGGAAEGGAGAESPAGEAASGAAGPVAGGAVSVPGSINSANDVIRTLDKICEYYQRYEPSSPIPILLMRARRLVSQDFMTIMKDIAPDGVSQAELVGGIGNEDMDE